MKPLLRLFAVVLGLASCLPVIRAEEFAIVGPRAMGMGGAGVATTRGALSTYWNPAGLAAPRGGMSWDVALFANVEANTTEDLLARLDSLADTADRVDFDGVGDSLDAGTGLTSGQLRDLLDLTNEISALDGNLGGNGLVAVVTPGLSVQVWRFGFSAMGLANVGGLIEIDTDLLSLGTDTLSNIITGSGVPTGADAVDFAGQLAADLASRGVADATRVANEIAAQAEAAGANVGDRDFQDLVNQIVDSTVSSQGDPLDPDELFSSNQTGVDVRGSVLQEYTLSYAHPFADIVSVGASVKLLYGRTYFNPFTLDNLDQFEDVVSEFNDGLDEDEINFAVDVGVLVQPVDWLAIGVVGKYLNSPEFDFSGPGVYRIDPQFRAGVAVAPMPNLTLALDFDILPNDTTALPGFDSQVVAFGVEYAAWQTLLLRGGVSKNFAESDDDVTLHAGLGVRVLGASIELAAMASTDWVEIEDDDSSVRVPEQGGASLMISFGVPLP